MPFFPGFISRASYRRRHGRLYPQYLGVSLPTFAITPSAAPVTIRTNGLIEPKTILPQFRSRPGSSHRNFHFKPQFDLDRAGFATDRPTFVQLPRLPPTTSRGSPGYLRTEVELAQRPGHPARPALRRPSRLWPTRLVGVRPLPRGRPPEHEVAPRAKHFRAGLIADRIFDDPHALSATIPHLCPIGNPKAPIDTYSSKGTYSKCATSRKLSGSDSHHNGSGGGHRSNVRRDVLAEIIPQIWQGKGHVAMACALD